MAIVTFQAKLYTGIRCLCVDKNIQANLSYAFTVGNYDIDFPPRPGNPSGDVPDLDVNGNPIIYPNIYPWRLRRAVADLQCSPTLTLTIEKLKTVGSGNTVNDGYFVTGQSYKIINVGDSDWNSISGEDRVDVAAVPGVRVARPTWIPGDEFVAQNNGQVPFLSPPAAEDPDPANPDTRNATPKTGKAHLASWTIKSTLTCQFPTYVEIDIEKLGLPEGTDCIVYFEEGFLLEDKGNLLPSGGYEYPNAVQGAPSPRIDNFIQFRTPWYGLSFMTATFNRVFLPTRIKQLSATFPQALGNVTIKARYNPGRLASLFVDDFEFNSAPVKTARVVAPLFVVTGGGSQQWNPFNYRIRSFDSLNNNINASLNIPDGWYYRGLASTTISSNFNLTSNIYVIEGIVANLPVNASVNADVTRIEMRYDYNMVTSMNTINVRPRTFNIATTSAITTNIVGVKVNIGSAALTTQSSLSCIGNKPMVIAATGGANIGLFGTVNGVINWGDGTETVATSENTYTKTYAVAGNYDITIRGTVTGYGKGLTGTLSHSPLSVKSFGEIGLTHLNYAFSQGTFNGYVPGKLPSTVTSLKGLFYSPSGAGQWNGLTYPILVGQEEVGRNPLPGINAWDTSNVTDMSYMFHYQLNYGYSIGYAWNTKNVTDMSYMFYRAYLFIGSASKSRHGMDINGVVTVTHQSSIGDWDTSSVTNLDYFNYEYNGGTGDLSKWCVTNISSTPTGWSGVGTNPVWGTCPVNTPKVTTLNTSFEKVVNGSLTPTYVALFKNNNYTKSGIEQYGNTYDRLIVNNFSDELVGNGYARLPVVSGTNTYTFNVATADWGYITHIALVTASSGGSVVKFYPTLNAKTILSGNQIRVTITI